MSWLADESVDRPIVIALREAGFDVPYVAEMAPGISDDEVLAEARRLDAVLLTADKDFGELVYRLNRASAGVVLLRLTGTLPSAKAALVREAVVAHGTQMRGAFTVIALTAIRIRTRD